MVTWILLTCTLAAGASGDAGFPGAPPPRPARAVLSADGRLTVTQHDPGYAKKMKAFHRGENLPEEFEVSVTFGSMTQTVLPSRFITAYRSSGKKIGAAPLAQLLRKETPVLIASSPQSVHPEHLQLFKEDVSILVLPEGTVSHGYGHGGYAMPAPAPVAPGPRPMPGEKIKQPKGPTPAPQPETE